MRLLVVSDTHGASRQLISLCERLKDIGGVIHAGDGENDVLALREKLPDLPVYAVYGNCDYGAHTLPEKLEFSLDGVSFFVAHGHRYGVKYGYENLVSAASHSGAKVAVFGHTHRQLCRFEGGMWIINPGSLVMNYTGRLLAGFVDIDNGTAVCHTAAIDGKKMLGGF